MDIGAHGMPCQEWRIYWLIWQVKPGWPYSLARRALREILPSHTDYLTLNTTRNSSISLSPIGCKGPIDEAMTSELAENSATSR